MHLTSRPTFLATLGLAACSSLALLACRSASNADEGSSSTAVANASAPSVQLDDEGHPAGLHRYHQWTPRITQGAQPEGDLAFQNLAALGFTTVISVDGAAPDVEGARKHGLRYVHVPIGYDGIPDEAALQIIKAVEGSQGPVYIHCHHGKHRGPAAAAIARIAEGDADNLEAEADLADSGCSPSYAGLYRDVREFRMPSRATLAALRFEDLPSCVVPSGLRDAMVHVDERFAFLKDSQAVTWAPPPSSPDVDPEHEAGMLENAFRGLIQSEEQDRRREGFLRYLHDSQQASSELEQALGRKDHTAAEAAYARLEQACNACHKEYRN